MEIRRVSDVLKETFGEKIYKIPLNAGCTCPNRDGTVGFGGCTFCSGSGSGDFAPGLLSLEEQIRESRRRIEGKTDARRFIGYFQSFSNTYGDQDRLKELFRRTAERPEIAVLSIGTRPDCLEPEMVEFLEELNRTKPVWVELGLQTVHEKTAKRFHRGYGLPAFEDAYRRLKDAGLTVIVHVILGLPGETRKEMLETAQYLAALTPALDGVKFHMLHLLEGTQMGEEYKNDPFPLLSLEEYTDIVVECMKILPEKTVIHRFTGDGPKRDLIGPMWTWDKKKVLNYMNKKIGEAER